MDVAFSGLFFFQILFLENLKRVRDELPWRRDLDENSESSRLQKRCLATLFAQWDPMVRQVNINVCLEPTEAKAIEL